MTILPLFRLLTALLIPLGQIGLCVAIVGAVALAIALAVDAAGVAGGGAALWLTGGMLSLGTLYTGDLMVPVAAAVALLVAIAVGLVCRRLVRRRPGAGRSPVVLQPAESARGEGFELNDVTRLATAPGATPRERTATSTIPTAAGRLHRRSVAQ